MTGFLFQGDERGVSLTRTISLVARLVGENKIYFYKNLVGNTMGSIGI